MDTPSRATNLALDHALSAVRDAAAELSVALAAQPPAAASGFPTRPLQDLLAAVGDFGAATDEGAGALLALARLRLVKLRHAYARLPAETFEAPTAFLPGDAIDQAIATLNAALDLAALAHARSHGMGYLYIEAPPAKVSADMRIALDQAGRKARLLAAEALGLAQGLAERTAAGSQTSSQLEPEARSLAALAGALQAELAMPDQQPRLLAAMAKALDQASDAVHVAFIPLAGLVEADDDRADWIGGFAWPALEAQTRHAEDLARELEGIADRLEEIVAATIGPARRLDWSNVNQRQMAHVGVSLIVAMCFGLVFGAFR